jgi:outer membrane protein insertion porin family
MRVLRDRWIDTGGRALGVIVSGLLVLSILSLPDLARGQAFPRMKSIRIEGNTRVDSTAIRIHIASEPGRQLSMPQLDADLRAVYEMGFFEDVVIEAEPAPGNQVDVIFRVVERPFIRDVRVEGESEIDEEELDEALGVR